jgi:hypothetical protein
MVYKGVTLIALLLGVSFFVSLGKENLPDPKL